MLNNDSLDAKINPIFEPFFTSQNRINLSVAGRGSGKSYHLSLLPIFLAKQKVMNDKGQMVFPKLKIALMRLTATDVRDGLWQEVNTRIEELGFQDDVKKFNNHTMRMTLENTEIVVKGFSAGNKSRSAKNKSLAEFTHIIFDEFNEVTDESAWNTFQTSLRGRVDKIDGIRKKPQLFLTCNPPQKDHWMYKRWFTLNETEHEGFYKPTLKHKFKKTVTFIGGTWKDNLYWISDILEHEGLAYLADKNPKLYEQYTNNPTPAVTRKSEAIMDEGGRLALKRETYDLYEFYKDSPLEKDQHEYLNQVLGLVPSIHTGLVYKGWEEIPDEEFDKIDAESFFGMDFGHKHPTTLVEVKKLGEKLYVKELLYMRGLLESSLVSFTKAALRDRFYSAPIVVDSAEPDKRIALERAGAGSIIPVIKTRGSILSGIEKVQEYQVFYTSSSKNIKEESRKYVYAKRASRHSEAMPIDNWNHALDAIRYVVMTYFNENVYSPVDDWIDAAVEAY